MSEQVGFEFSPVASNRHTVVQHLDVQVARGVDATVSASMFSSSKDLGYNHW